MRIAGSCDAAKRRHEVYSGLLHRIINAKRWNLRNPMRPLRFHPFKTGIVYRKSPNAIFVAARQGTLVVQQVSDDDRSPVLPKIRLDDRLQTPRQHLDEAMGFRPIYSPEGIKQG